MAQNFKVRIMYQMGYIALTTCIKSAQITS
jgi:hypothetical protein